MAKAKHLKLTPRGIAILVVFVVCMIVATYFFTGYLLTGSFAKAKSKVKEMPNGTKYWCTDSGKNCYSGLNRLGTQTEVQQQLVEQYKKIVEESRKKEEDRQKAIQEQNSAPQDKANTKYNMGGGMEAQ